MMMKIIEAQEQFDRCCPRREREKKNHSHDIGLIASLLGMITL